jgi:hypothetical protein
MIFLRFDVKIVQIFVCRSVHVNLFLNMFELILFIMIHGCNLFVSMCLWNSLDLPCNVDYFTELVIIVSILELRDFKIGCTSSTRSRVFVDEEIVTEGVLCKHIVGRRAFICIMRGTGWSEISHARSISNGLCSSFQVFTGHWFPWDTFSSPPFSLSH